MKLTVTQFRKILEDHGFLAMTDDPYRSCLAALRKLESAGTQEFIAFFCDRYKERYSFTPKIVGKTAGVAKRIVEALGLDEACRYAEAYLKGSEYRWTNSRHSLEILEQSFLGVQQLLETGKGVTRAQLIQDDRAQANLQTVRELMETKPEEANDPKG